MKSGYIGVRKASNFPLAMTEPAATFESVSPAVGLGPKMKIIRNAIREHITINISLLFFDSISCSNNSENLLVVDLFFFMIFLFCIDIPDVFF